MLVALGAVVALGGCGPTAQEIAAREQQAARERETRERFEAFLREVAELNRTCCRAATHEAWQREYNRRFRALAETYGQSIDAYRDAEMAFWVAVAERQDRGELSRAQAEAAIAEFRLRLQQERERQAAEERRALYQTLGLLQAQRQAEAARLDAWNQFWLNMSLIQLLQRPIQCRTTYIGGLVRTQCD